MGFCGVLWGSIGVYGVLYGTLWGLMGGNGGSMVLWGSLGFYGGLWGVTGFYGR